MTTRTREELGVVTFEALRAHAAGDEWRVHFLLRNLSRRELLGVTKAMADVAVVTLQEALRAVDHPEPEKWTQEWLTARSEEAVAVAMRAMD
ncbi:hypothetical protein [Streptomyces cyaneofuscatus]|uniref:hypothetical protein n=1 Tax=Streptomyces cyaneofuscatus TaxID=66883 RepID=UPI0036DED246